MTRHRRVVKREEIEPIMLDIAESNLADHLAFHVGMKSHLFTDETLDQLIKQCLKQIMERSARKSKTIGEFQRAVGDLSRYETSEE